MGRDTIGNYKVVKEIGRGGMGHVYSAHQLSLERLVVIKEMNRSLSAGSLARFRREATVCANLHHKNIVEIYDFFKEGTAHYLVMEYVDGVSLDEIVKHEAPLHPKAAAGIAREICRALACAHEHGIVHRDIKPKNIMISRLGNVKLTDFGVARDMDAPDLTTTGEIIGTPFYMSPEQAAGEAVSFQSDVYSLGIVLYEMLTAKKPFTGENSQAIIGKICRGGYRSPFWLDPHHSIRLTGIIKKAMRRNPKRRFRDAGDMTRTLDRFLGWKGQAQIDDAVRELMSRIDSLRESTTIVKKEKKKKRKKRGLTISLLLFLILLLITVLIFAYIINLS